jgi:hypothetical protein
MVIVPIAIGIGALEFRVSVAQDALCLREVDYYCFGAPVD